jgi:hypothetical protein
MPHLIGEEKEADGDAMGAMVVMVVMGAMVVMEATEATEAGVVKEAAGAGVANSA